MYIYCYADLLLKLSLYISFADGQFLKPEIFLNPKSQVVLKGENITLNCSAASTESQGSPTHFQWRKDDFVSGFDCISFYENFSIGILSS